MEIKKTEMRGRKTATLEEKEIETRDLKSGWRTGGTESNWFRFLSGAINRTLFVGRMCPGLSGMN